MRVIVGTPPLRHAGVSEANVSANRPCNLLRLNTCNQIRHRVRIPTRRGGFPPSCALPLLLPPAFSSYRLSVIINHLMSLPHHHNAFFFQIVLFWILQVILLGTYQKRRLWYSYVAHQFFYLDQNCELLPVYIFINCYSFLIYYSYSLIDRNEPFKNPDKKKSDKVFTLNY